MRKFVARCTPWGTIQTGPGFACLSSAEQNAVLAHERGHLALRHPWKRIWWVLTLRALFDFDGFVRMCETQEFEADWFAVMEGHRVGLISFFIRCRMNSKAPGHPAMHERLEAIRHV